MNEPQDYGRMISRHVDRLLSIFPSEKVDRVPVGRGEAAPLVGEALTAKTSTARTASGT